MMDAQVPGALAASTLFQARKKRKDILGLVPWACFFPNFNGVNFFVFDLTIQQKDTYATKNESFI